MASISRWKYASVDVAVEDVTPLYDNLLVRRLDDPVDQNALIIDPMVQQAKGGQWVRKTDSGPRKGVVVAAGRGDKIPWHCTWCMRKCWPDDPDREPQEGELVTCPECGTIGCSDRMPMWPQIGDIIIYPRFESSHVVIRGERLTFVHEADVMAVIEE